mgnify:CR=1 FL=1
MKAELLQEIIERINSVKIAVVGDFCLDAYWFVDESKSEISIETCHATRPVRQQKYSLGEGITELIKGYQVIKRNQFSNI